MNALHADRTAFRRQLSGKPVDLYRLTNSGDLEVTVTNYGARIVSVSVPDRRGIRGDVIMGGKTLDALLKDSVPYCGAVIGRYANRISGGTFTLDGKQYNLTTNMGAHHIHGGEQGFDKVTWDTGTVDDHQIMLSYYSRHMEEGYPGNLEISVRYTLTDDNELEIDYTAIADRKTIINITNHAYFNLAANHNDPIYNHQLTIHAEEYTRVDASLIPTGAIVPVRGTPFDFRKPKPIGKDINRDEEQLNVGNGYDHNFVLDKAQINGVKPAARMVEPTSGRTLTVLTTEPGLQFFTGEILRDEKNGNRSRGEAKNAFCLETQHFPDSPNNDQFPSVVLKAGEKFHSQTVYRFGVLE